MVWLRASHDVHREDPRGTVTRFDFVHNTRTDVPILAGRIGLAGWAICMPLLLGMSHMGQSRPYCGVRPWHAKRPRRASVQSQIETNREALSCACGSRLSRLSDARG